jgi:rRNA maturation endonuclease Nob1
MSRFDENLYGRIALFHGFLRREQLRECLEEERATPGADLGKILLAKGYLTEEQLGIIQDIRRKKARKVMRDLKEVERNEKCFGQIALSGRFIDHGDLERAVLEQERLRRLNLHFRLGEVLVALGILSVEDVLEILAEQKKRILLCRACDCHYSVFGYRPEEEYRCKECGGALVEPLFLDTVAVDGVINDPGSGEEKGREG